MEIMRLDLSPIVLLASGGSRSSGKGRFLCFTFLVATSGKLLRIIDGKLHHEIVNSRFLERPQKRNRGNQLIHRRLTRTKSIGSRQDPESQACRQSDGYGG